VRPRRLLLRIPAALRRAGPRAGAAGLVLALLATGSAAGPAAGVVSPVAPRETPASAAMPQPPGATTLVSQKFGGGFPGGGSIMPSISSNGRYVAFASGSADLVPGDTNQAVDVFVRDRSKGTTIRLPLPGGAQVPPGAQAMEPAISGDGKVVAFTYLAPASVTATTTVVLAWDRDTGKTEIVSRNGRVTAGQSSEPSVSNDGRYIAYTSEYGKLVVGDSNQAADVFRFDREKGTSILVSVGSQGGTPSGASGQPSISSDGSKVAFTSEGGDSIVSENTGPGLQVYLRDITAKTTERISGAPGGGSGGAPANGAAEAPSISADGRYVAFESTAGNLVGALDGGVSQVYRQTGLTEIVSVDSNGAPSRDGSGQAAISRDGRMVAFASMTMNLVVAAPLGAVPSVRLAAVALRNGEVYIRDMVAGETALVSVGLSGGGAGARSLGPVVAGNGRYVAFYSNAQTLVDGDTGRTVDVFIRDFPPAPMLNPPIVDFGSRAVGTDPVSGAAVLANAGWGPLSVSGVTIDGPAKGDYTIQADGCTRMTLHRSEACTVTVGFSPTGAGARTATLNVADNYKGSPRTARLSGRGSLAALVLSSEVARPGLVVIATGSGFPPGAQVRLRWSRGITEDLPVITADANGAFSHQVLVFHNDLLGERDLLAESAGGSPFPPVAVPLLVTESPMGPPAFEIMRLLLDLPLVLMFRG
jgi:Tol biopolymer transport system component